MKEVREVRVREARTLGRPVNADVTVPGSKSLANRALICAALAAGESVLTGCPDGDDTLRMIEAIQTLGCEVSRDLDQGECRVQGLSQGPIPVANADLFVGASGTCLRFLTALAAVGSGEVTIRGTERLHERPIGDLIDALRQLGASITCADGGYPPITIHGQGNGLRGGRVEISGAVSSQFASGLMLAAPAANAPLEVNVTGTAVSKPFITMTTRVMAAFGAAVEDDGENTYRIAAPRAYQPTRYAVEGDATAATYFLAAAAVCGGRCRVTNLGKNSVQGDIAFVHLLERMGCEVTMEAEFIEVRRSPAAPLRALPGETDLNAIPDVVQTLAAIAPFAQGTTRITNIANLRVKETDRIGAMAAELRRLGAQVEAGPDFLHILGDGGASLHGARVRTYEDHRMAMSLAVIGLRVGGVLIEDPACVSKTFPAFWDIVQTL